jgi:hypothetical protein
VHSLRYSYQQALLALQEAGVLQRGALEARELKRCKSRKCVSLTSLCALLKIWSNHKHHCSCDFYCPPPPTEAELEWAAEHPSKPRARQAEYEAAVTRICNRSHLSDSIPTVQHDAHDPRLPEQGDFDGRISFSAKTSTGPLASQQTNHELCVLEGGTGLASVRYACYKTGFPGYEEENMPTALLAFATISLAEGPIGLCFKNKL